MDCVSGERLVAAIASRRPELWDSNPRLAERIEMRIKDAQRAHRQAHGASEPAARCLAERQARNARRASWHNGARRQRLVGDRVLKFDLPISDPTIDDLQRGARRARGLENVLGTNA